MSYLTENFNKYGNLGKEALNFYLKSHCHSMRDLGGVAFKSSTNFQEPKKTRSVANEQMRHSAGVIMAHMTDGNGSDIKFWRVTIQLYDAAYLEEEGDTVKFVLYKKTNYGMEKDDPNVQIFEMAVGTAMTRIEFDLDDLLA